MRRVVDKPVPVSETRTRHTMKVFDDPSQGVDVRRRQVEFLREFVEQPALLQLGPTFAQKMAFYHDGIQWVMSAEAEAENA